MHRTQKLILRTVMKTKHKGYLRMQLWIAQVLPLASCLACSSIDKALQGWEVQSLNKSCKIGFVNPLKVFTTITNISWMLNMFKYDLREVKASRIIISIF